MTFPSPRFLALLLLSSTCQAQAATASAPVSPLVHTLLALAVIIAFARACGIALQRWLGQPLVIGEIIAGILLGPSLLGRLAPEAHAFLFPASVQPFLSLLATLGVVLFMFLVGLAMNPSELRQQGRAAGAVAAGGMLLPMAAGIFLALAYQSDFIPAGTRPAAFVFFVCIALAVTAFPVLARLIEERGLIGSPTGTLALTAAALGDTVAWVMMFLCILLSGHSQPHWFSLFAGFALLALLLLATRHWAHRPIGDDSAGSERGHLAVVGSGLLLAAAAAELAGLHAVMGAFLFGLVLPHDSALSRSLRPQVEQVAVALLLPVFFAMLGTQLELDLLNVDDLPAFACIMLIAVAGKIGGSYLGARLAGVDNTVARAVALLMNTRGLMELVVLKIGLDLGLINGRLFTLLVLMALVTTLSTPLLLDLFARPAAARKDAGAPADNP